jgi:hypothetical protein
MAACGKITTFPLSGKLHVKLRLYDSCAFPQVKSGSRLTDRGRLTSISGILAEARVLYLSFVSTSCEYQRALLITVDPWLGGCIHFIHQAFLSSLSRSQKLMLEIHQTSCGYGLVSLDPSLHAAVCKEKRKLIERIRSKAYHGRFH